MDFFLIACWEIWNIRNSKIFDTEIPSIGLWVRKFKRQAHLQPVRVREDKQYVFSYFLETVTSLFSLYTLPPCFVSIVLL
jgi:hypothetical protein